MNHKGTKPTETKRLVLRPFRMEDVEPMYRNWASDQDVTRYLTWNVHTSVEITKQILTNWIFCMRRLLLEKRLSAVL